MPDRPDLEKEDSSTHHDALHIFAQYLARANDATQTVLLAQLVEAAGWWVRFKAAIGKFMLRIGAAMTKDLEKFRQKRVARTTAVAFRVLNEK